MVNTLELRPWVPIDDIEHTKTSWEVASDVNFEDIVDSSYEDEVNLNIFYTFIEIPIGVKYYGRAKRHFSDGSESSWTQPKVIEIVEDELTTGLPINITVDTPMIYVDKEEIIKEDSFKIRCSKFRGEGDGHASTSWIIMNERKEIIYKNMEDTNNKLSIIVNKSELTNKTYNRISIYCIHNTYLGKQSEVGYKEVTLYDVNFEVISPLHSILPYRDYELLLKKKIEDNKTGVYRIEVLSMDKELIHTQDFEDTDLTRFIIPGGVLESNSEYFVDLYVYMDSTTTNTVRILLSTLELGVNEVIDPNYVYDKTVKYIADVSDPLMESGVSTHELNGGLIPVIHDDDDVLKGYFDRTKNITVLDGDKVVGNLSMDNAQNENSYIRILNNNIVLVDTKDDDGYPVFKVYKYNPINVSCELIQTKVRDDEEDPIGKTNAIVRIDNDNFIYMPTNSGKLLNYNIPDNEITEITTVPNKDMKNGVIFYIGNNRIMVVGGSENKCYSYHLENQTFLETMRIEERFIDREIKVNQLINGDYLIVRTTSKDEDDNGDIVYYDSINDRMIIVKVDYDVIPYFDGCIRLIDGPVVLFDTKDDTNKYFLFE